MLNYTYPLVRDSECGTSFAQMLPPQRNQYSPPASGVNLQPMWLSRSNLSHAFGAASDSFPFTYTPSSEHTFSASPPSHSRSPLQTDSNATSFFTAQFSGSFTAEFASAPRTPAVPNSFPLPQTQTQPNPYQQPQTSWNPPSSSNMYETNAYKSQQWSRSSNTGQHFHYSNSSAQLQTPVTDTQFSPSTLYPYEGSPNAYSYTGLLGAVADAQQGACGICNYIGKRDPEYPRADLQVVDPHDQQGSTSFGLGWKREWSGRFVQNQSGIESGPWSRAEMSASQSHVVLSESPLSSSSDSGFRELSDEAVSLSRSSKRSRLEVLDKSSTQSTKYKYSIYIHSTKLII